MDTNLQPSYGTHAEESSLCPPTARVMGLPFPTESAFFLPPHSAPPTSAVSAVMYTVIICEVYSDHVRCGVIICDVYSDHM